MPTPRAPFVLAFGSPPAMVNCVAVGCLACALAASALQIDKEILRLRRTRIMRR